MFYSSYNAHPLTSLPYRTPSLIPSTYTATTTHHYSICNHCFNALTNLLYFPTPDTHPQHHPMSNLPLLPFQPNPSLSPAPAS
ncbi:hypothetical protein Pmani_025229 [Petrolisthes manimaculis]|uniref:Uncharacterized protein n=1 Tax=Petrolisthes manimaculis TaxID=1843537 RepID=A0AAE1P862_9EUCA|nr:hypothetical protein Pmani_025229 [Petrolisthes manimaculis]